MVTIGTILRTKPDKGEHTTAPTQKAGFRFSKTVLW